MQPIAMARIVMTMIEATKVAFALLLLSTQLTYPKLQKTEPRHFREGLAGDWP